MKDLRFALRQLARAPGFTSTVVLTLALGIGATTAVFSVMNAIMLRYLPVPDPQRLVMLRITSKPRGFSQTGYDETTSLTLPAFQAFRTQDGSVSDLMGFVPLGGGNSKISVRFGKDPEEAAVDEVSGNFFAGLGVKVFPGRGFEIADENNHTQVGILSYRFWTRKFARDPSILNRTFYIKGVPFTVIGVASPDFVGLERDQSTDVWVPFQNNPNLKPWGSSAQDPETFYGTPNWFFLMAVARLRPDVSIDRATAQLDATYKGVLEQMIGSSKPDSVPSKLVLVPARGVEGARERFRQPLAILMVMVALVLLIACSNVAMLLLARNAGRLRDFSFRVALGAGPGALFRQLLIESLVLVAIGGVLAWMFVVFSTRLLAAWSHLDFSLAPDRQVLLFAFVICALVEIIFGLVPLKGVLSVPAGLALRGSVGSVAPNSRRFGLRHVVVALQISLCLVLLVGAGLLVGTLRNLQNANLGFRSSGLLVFGLTPPEDVHGDPGIVHFHTALLERLRTVHGVESATLMENRLGAGWSGNSGILVDSVAPEGKQFAAVRWNTVGPDYFRVLGIPLLLGRDFTSADSASSPRVAIIDETFAKAYLNGGNAIGHHIALSHAPNDRYTVIAVARDSTYTSVRETPHPVVYLPFTQVSGIGMMNFELRTAGGPNSVLPQVRKAMEDFGPDLVMLQPMTQQEQFDLSFTDERLYARLALFFGVLAGLLVAIGLYGTLTYRVNRRTSEIGVRMALGAQRSQVLWMILRESLLVSLMGVLVGLPLAIFGGRLLQAMLFGLSAGDPLILLLAIALLFAVTLAASVIPAGRALSIDPIVALRYE
jgi:predicted permease